MSMNKIAIFGIRPNKPETGYGYLKISDAKIEDGGGGAFYIFLKNRLKDKF